MRSTPPCCENCRSPGPIGSGRWAKLHPHGPWRLGWPRIRGGSASPYLAAAKLVHLACSGMAAVDHAGGRFCIDAVEDALERHGAPEIFNSCAIGLSRNATSGPSAHVHRLTSTDVVKVLAAREISMDGKGPGATLYLLRASGGPSNTNRSICGTMPECPKPAPGLADTPDSATAAHRLHHLTGKRTIRPTSTRRYPKPRRPSQAGKPITKTM